MLKSLILNKFTPFLKFEFDFENVFAKEDNEAEEEGVAEGEHVGSNEADDVEDELAANELVQEIGIGCNSDKVEQE